MTEPGKKLLYMARMFLVLLVLLAAYFIWTIHGTCHFVTYHVPDTNIPVIRLHRGGWMDSIRVHVLLERPLFNKKVLRLSGGLPRELYDTDPPPVDAQIIRASSSKHSPYGISWSADGERLACTYFDWFIGAYDLRSGHAIQPYRGNKESALHAHSDIDIFLIGN